MYDFNSNTQIINTITCDAVVALLLLLLLHAKTKTIGDRSAAVS
jgi:hypothetical protein